MGGRLATVEDGDTIIIDAEQNSINVLLDTHTIEDRLKVWKQPKKRNEWIFKQIC